MVGMLGWTPLRKSDSEAWLGCLQVHVALFLFALAFCFVTCRSKALKPLHSSSVDGEKRSEEEMSEDESVGKQEKKGGKKKKKKKKKKGKGKGRTDIQKCIFRDDLHVGI